MVQDILVPATKEGRQCSVAAQYTENHRMAMSDAADVHGPVEGVQAEDTHQKVQEKEFPAQLVHMLVCCYGLPNSRSCRQWGWDFS